MTTLLTKHINKKSAKIFMAKESDKEKSRPLVFDDIKKKVKEEAHKEYNTFIGFLGILIRTVNPLSYKKLCTASTIEGFRFYFHILVFSFFLFALFTVPYMISFYDELQSESNNLNNFSLAPQLDVNQVIEFEDFGIVVANQKPYDGETILITQQSVSWKNGLCLMSSIICLWDNEPHQLDFSRAHLFVEDRERFAFLVFGFILLMLPGIFILLFFYLLVKFFLVILLYMLIGIVYTTLIRYEVHARQLFLVAVYSLTITIVVEIVFGFYYNTYYIPYVLSFILFVVCTYLVSEKPFHHFKHGH